MLFKTRLSLILRSYSILQLLLRRSMEHSKAIIRPRLRQTALLRIRSNTHYSTKDTTEVRQTEHSGTKHVQTVKDVSLLFEINSIQNSVFEESLFLTSLCSPSTLLQGKQTNSKICYYLFRRIRE
jgi:hypothetical protein